MLNKTLKKIKGNFNEQHFLLSENFKSYLLQQAKVISGKYDLKIKFSKRTCTDGDTIEVNPLHPYLNSLTLEEKVLSILGSLVHELFHILYTDFDIFVKSLEDFEEKYGATKRNVFKQIINIVEDSYIELRGINYYTGTFRTAILFSNKNAFSYFENIEDFASNNSDLNTILMICASYSILGNIKGKIKNKKISSVFKKIKPLLDKGRLEKNSIKRMNYCKEIYYLIEPFILEDKSDKDKDKEFDYPKNMTDFNNSPNKQMQKEIRNNDNNDDNNNNNNSSNNSNTNTNTNDSNSNSNDSNDGNNDDGNSNQKQVKHENDINLSEEDLDKTLKNLQGAIKRNKNKYIQELEDDFKEEEIKKDIKNLENIDLEGIHKGIKIKTIKVSNKNSNYKYADYYKELSFLTNNLIRKMKEILLSNTNYKLDGFYSGRLSKKRLYRQDNKIFSKIIDKKDISDLAIIILVDQSGSMARKRIEYAKKACCIFAEVCQRLDITFSIIGHTAIAGADIVEHRHFIDFDSTLNQKYSLMNMETYTNTREGLSLLYAKEYIAKRPEKDKIIIAISDGQPIHQSFDLYMGEIASQDVKKQVKSITKENIKVIGLAIGEDKSIIKDLYNPNFIDIKNLDSLPVKLTKIIKQNLLK